MRSELREFYEGEMQSLDDLITVLVVHDAVVVDEIRSIMRKDVIYQVERIHGLEFAVFSSLFSLTHIELGGIEQYSLLEGIRPFHLHLHTELPVSYVGAEYINNGILAPFELGHKFCWQILDFMYLLFFAEWQEGVQKTDQSFRVIAEYLLEREVCLRIQVLHNQLFLNSQAQSYDFIFISARVFCEKFLKMLETHIFYIKGKNLCKSV